VTDWTAFAGFAGVVVVLFLLLARASQSMISHDDPAAKRPEGPGIPTEAPARPDAPTHPEVPARPDAPTHPEAPADRPRGADGPADTPVQGNGGTAVKPAEGPRTEAPPRERRTASPAERTLADPRPLGTGELLANVLATHGLFALLLAGAAAFWRVPPEALGVSGPAAPAVAWGVALGVALYVADEVGAAATSRLGVDHDEALRELLSPSSPSGWALLLGGVLPAVAVGEELLFRGVLVGGYAAGLGLPAWGLAVVSSVAFALGHGAQGRGGVLVTGLLGFVLAAAFVLSGSLLLVVVAHYVVNALEFVVHEGLGVEWADRL